MVAEFFQIFNVSDNSNLLYGIFAPIFKVISGIFGKELTLIVPLFLIFIILFFILPYFIVTFVNQKENKIKEKKYIILIDVVLFLMFFICGFGELCFWSDEFIALSNRAISYELWLFWLRFVGFFVVYFIRY